MSVEKLDAEKTSSTVVSSKKKKLKTLAGWISSWKILEKGVSL